MSPSISTLHPLYHVNRYLDGLTKLLDILADLLGNLSSFAPTVHVISAKLFVNQTNLFGKSCLVSIAIPYTKQIPVCCHVDKKSFVVKLLYKRGDPLHCESHNSKRKVCFRFSWFPWSYSTHGPVCFSLCFFFFFDFCGLGHTKLRVGNHEAEDMGKHRSSRIDRQMRRKFEWGTVELEGSISIGIY